MQCLRCDCEQFVEKQVRFDPEIKNEVVEVIVPCTVCRNCEAPHMNDDQMNFLRRTAADKYRERHGFAEAQINVLKSH
jgi:Fe-S oxidoreductase